MVDFRQNTVDGYDVADFTLQPMDGGAISVAGMAVLEAMGEIAAKSPRKMEIDGHW